MTLCATGSISLGGTEAGRSVNVESRRSATQTISMGETNIRDLADKSTGAISMSDFRGKSWAPTSFGQCKIRWGGIYMGTISAANSCYYLFVSPNATGCAFCQWKTTTTSTSGTSSFVDGFSNTYGPLDNTTHPAGNWCATRTIAGFSDWYLPAVDELKTFYANGATGDNQSVIGSGQAFVGCFGRYWSSTEYYFYAPQYAWSFLFGFCLPAYDYKTVGHRARAVRRIPI